jgi:hypothetical protein
MTAHSRKIDNNVRTDGDLDAVVVLIPDTGDSSIITDDRYRHVIRHGLRRVPVGCQVIMSDDFVNVRVLAKNDNDITVQFDRARSYVNMRIW